MDQADELMGVRICIWHAKFDEQVVKNNTLAAACGATYVNMYIGLDHEVAGQFKWDSLLFKKKRFGGAP